MIRPLALALAAAIPMVHAAAPPAPAPYTESQAAEGAALYAQRCAMCHGARLEGTFEVPGLTGKFVANWAGRPVGDLSLYLSRAMPQFAPGTLTPEESARLVAFILQANGYPAGSRPLLSAPETLQRLVLPPPPARPGAALAARATVPSR